MEDSNREITEVSKSSKNENLEYGIGESPPGPTLDYGENTESPPKKKHKHGVIYKRLVALVSLFLCFAMVTGILVYAAGTRGDGGSIKSTSFTPSRNCNGEIVYYPILTVSPLKLLNYVSRSGEGELNMATLLTKGNIKGDSVLPYGDGKKLDLSKNPGLYYGNTIMGFNDGMMVMPSSNCYNKYPNSDLPIYLHNQEIALLYSNKSNLETSDKITSHIIYFRRDTAQERAKINKSVSVGANDDKDVNSPRVKHIFTNALYEKSGNKYDMASLAPKLAKDNAWKKVITDGRVDKSFDLWEAISYVEYTDGKYVLEPMDKIIDYLSPNSSTSLWNNITEDGSSVAKMSEKEKQLVFYHELDLLLSLYSVAANNSYMKKVDSKLAQTWADVIRQFLDGWDDPATLNKIGKDTVVYDTIALGNASTYVDEPGGSTEGVYIIPTGDYIDEALNLDSGKKVTDPATANTYTVSTEKNSADVNNNKRGIYMYNLCRAAVAASNIKSCPAKTNGKSLLGQNYLENVIGHEVEFDSGSKVSLTYGKSDYSFKNTGAVLQLNENVYGSNLVFISPWTESVKEALPQYSVNLGIKSNKYNDAIKEGSKDSDGNGGEATIGASIGETAVIDDTAKLQFRFTANLGDNIDKYFKDADYKVRDKKENEEVVKDFFTQKANSDLSMTYHLKRFVCVDSINGKMASDGSKKEGKKPKTNNALKFKEPEGTKSGTGFQKHDLVDNEKQLKIGSIGTLTIIETKDQEAGDAVAGLDSTVATKIKNELSKHGNKFQVADIWISYNLPNLGDNSTTYRYGMVAAALGADADERIAQTLTDAALDEYGVYMDGNSEEEKKITVTYKIVEAYLNYTNDAVEGTLSDEEKKISPYKEYKNLAFENDNLKDHVAIRAAGTGKPVTLIYKFVPFPDVTLTPSVRASVGGLLDLTEAGGTKNEKETGIEDTDSKFNTHEGYVKEGSELIDDVPSVTFSFDQGDSKPAWDELLGDAYENVYLCMTVQRELSTEGTGPENIESNPWLFNYQANGGISATDQRGQPAPSHSLFTGTNGINHYFYIGYQGNLLKNAALVGSGTDGKLRGASISEILNDENPRALVSTVTLRILILLALDIVISSRLQVHLQQESTASYRQPSRADVSSLIKR